MSINLNIEVNFIKIFHLFRINFTNSASILIDIFINCNIKINLIKFFCSFCVNNSLFNDNINLFCNVNNNFVFNNKIFS